MRQEIHERRDEGLVRGDFGVVFDGILCEGVEECECFIEVFFRI